MISSTFIALYLFAMPVVTGLIAFGMSTVRSSTLIARPKWEIAAGGLLSIVLLSLAILILTPNWFSRFWAISSYRSTVQKQDSAELAADSALLTRYEERQKSPANPTWLERWDFYSMDEPFPLQPIAPEQAAEFIKQRIDQYDEYLTRMDWRAAPRAADNHCEIRQWDAAHGDWNSPLMIWFVRPPNAGMQEGRSSYSGFAVIRGGYPAQLLDDHKNDGDLEGGNRLFERQFFNRYGGDYVAIPIEPDGGAHYLDEDLYFFTSDEVIPIVGNVGQRRARLRALPNGSYELTRFLHDSEPRFIVRLTFGQVETLEPILNDPQDTDDDVGYPVSVYFFSEPENLQRRRFGIGIAKDRSEYQWRKAHPGRPYREYFMVRNAGTTQNPQPTPKNSPEQRSALRWTYETNFTEVPTLHGEVRCIGKPPGEMRAIMNYRATR